MEESRQKEAEKLRYEILAPLYENFRKKSIELDAVKEEQQKARREGVVSKLNFYKHKQNELQEKLMRLSREIAMEEHMTSSKIMKKHNTITRRILHRFKEDFTTQHKYAVFASFAILFIIVSAVFVARVLRQTSFQELGVFSYVIICFVLLFSYLLHHKERKIVLKT